jgi:hypothetical protein
VIGSPDEVARAAAHRRLDEQAHARAQRRPQLTDLVVYRTRQGLQTYQSAIVTATVDSLHPSGVAAGAVPPLTGEHHVHLWVFTPGETNGFAEYDVAPALDDRAEIAPGQYRPARCRCR